MCKTATDIATTVPAKLGEAIDFLYAFRQRRLAAQKLVDELATAEKAVEAELLARFSKQDLEQAKGRDAVASISRAEVPVADDWDLIQQYILSTGSFDLVQKRLSSTAVRARWGEHEEVPGVGKFTQIGLSLRKAS